MNGLIHLAGPAANPAEARAVERIPQPSRTEEAHGAAPGSDLPQGPRLDEYSPGEQPVSAGVYGLSHDEDGTPKIVFDDPEQAPKAESPTDGRSTPQKTQGEKRCTGSTNRVDAEIRKLEKKLAELQQRLAQAADAPQEQAKLQKQIAQVSDELQTKSSDSYRRQHTQYQTSPGEAGA